VARAHDWARRVTALTRNLPVCHVCVSSPMAARPYTPPVTERLLPWGPRKMLVAAGLEFPEFRICRNPWAWPSCFPGPGDIDGTRVSGLAWGGRLMSVFASWETDLQPWAPGRKVWEGACATLLWTVAPSLWWSQQAVPGFPCPPGNQRVFLKCLTSSFRAHRPWSSLTGSIVPESPLSWADHWASLGLFLGLPCRATRVSTHTLSLTLALPASETPPKGAN
jgi:hypothetical protein